MKLRILGSGTSSGVPRIGPDWGVCDPAEPRNRRTRASLLVEHDGVRVLVDTSPDLREQLLAAQVTTVDAVIWTHDHADHCHGIDDLRQVFHALGRPVVGYARPDVVAALYQIFGQAKFERAATPVPTAEDPASTQSAEPVPVVVRTKIHPFPAATSTEQDAPKAAAG